MTEDEKRVSEMAKRKEGRKEQENLESLNLWPLVDLIILERENPNIESPTHLFYSCCDTAG